MKKYIERTVDLYFWDHVEDAKKPLYIKLTGVVIYNEDEHLTLIFWDLLNEDEDEGTREKNWKIFKIRRHR